MAYCDYYYYTSSWFSLQGYCKKKEELGERDSRVTSDEEKQYCEGYTSYKNCPVYNSSNSGSLCIVTQVLCYCKGLSDRCRTMMAIRAFRDNVLASTEEGKAMISEYYEVSESFALRLKTLSKEDRQGILERFYQISVRILPSSIGGEMNHTHFSQMHISSRSAADRIGGFLLFPAKCCKAQPLEKGRLS